MRGWNDTYQPSGVNPHPSPSPYEGEATRVPALHFTDPTIGIRFGVSPKMLPRFLLQAGNGLCMLGERFILVCA
jgi:hypothetical protein